MPDEETTGEAEGEEGEGSEESKGEENASEEKTGDEEVDQVAELKEQLESLKSTSVTKGDLQTLTAAVGRIQSLANKLEKNGDVSGLQDQVTEQFGSVYDILTPILEGLDETALSPEAKQRALAARDTARTRAAKAELKEEIKRELAPANPEPAQQTSTSQLEVFIMDTIKAQGLNDTDPRFDWKVATEAGRTGGSGAIVKYFQDKIEEIKTEDSASTRRETRKKNAGSESPKGGGGQRTAQEVINAAYEGENISIEDQMKALKELGVEMHA